VSEIPFIQALGDALDTAIATSPQRSHKRLERLRPPKRLAVVLVGLVVSGSAAAAVISLSAKRSQPLAGTVPGAPASHSPGLEAVSLSGAQYRITVTPDLTAGDIGWCTTINYTYRGKSGPGSGGECGSSYPTRNAPLFGPGASSFGFSAPAPQIGDTVHYLLTGPGVGYVRVGKTTIAVRDDPALPAGDGVVVFFLPAAAPPVIVPLPGQHPPYSMPMYVPPHSTRDRMPPWLPRKSGLQQVPTTPAIPLDRAGREISIAQSRSYGVSSRWWQRPDHQPTGRCQLTSSGLPGLTAEWGHVIDRIKPAPSVQGTAFLSCVSTEYYLNNWGLEAAILLNAGHPGQPVGAIPGTEPVTNHPGLVTSTHPGAFGAATARRDGNAWLIVQGGRDLAQRLQVLNALRIHHVKIRS
jgi:hypothetical protein